MNKMFLHVGDTKNIGHGKSEKIMIETNFRSYELEHAYEKGCEKVGFDVVEHCCTHYQETDINEEDRDRLEELGLTTGYYLGMTPRDFAELYLQIANLGEKKLKYKILDDELSVIEIGGYGVVS